MSHSEVATITTTASITDEQIRGLLASAFEGGSNYWYTITGKHLAPGLTMADFREGGKMQTPGDYWHWAELIPLAEGCHLLIGDREADDPAADARSLGRAEIARGLQIMADKYPRHFADAVGDGGDADTGDVFLQCCLFGTLVYG